MNRRTALVAVAAACAVGALTACGNDDSSAPKGDAVAITATDSECKVAKTSFDPGPVTFAVTNKGQQTTEVYVYGQQGGAFTKVITEVENIGPGITRDLNATLSGGTYEIACKPGQTGNGIRTPITVSGAAASEPATGDAAYDREIEVEVTAAGVQVADGLTAKVGEKIEFKLGNKTDAKRELEILDPSGKVVSEVEADANGEAETIVPLTSAGTWTLKVEGQGVAEVEKPIIVS